MLSSRHQGGVERFGDAGLASCQPHEIGQFPVRVVVDRPGGGESGLSCQAAYVGEEAAVLGHAHLDVAESRIASGEFGGDRCVWVPSGDEVDSVVQVVQGIA